MIYREMESEFTTLKNILPNLPKKQVDEYELLMGAIEYIRNLNEILKAKN